MPMPYAPFAFQRLEVPRQLVMHVFIEMRVRNEYFDGRKLVRVLLLVDLHKCAVSAYYRPRDAKVLTSRISVERFEYSSGAAADTVRDGQSRMNSLSGLTVVTSRYHGIRVSEFCTLP